MSTDLHRRLLDETGDCERYGVTATEKRIAATLRAVIELHKPVMRGGLSFCEGCDEGTARGAYDEEPPSWPCSTIRTITEALGIPVERECR